jgi:hypothetical protein
MAATLAPIPTRRSVSNSGAILRGPAVRAAGAVVEEVVVEVEVVGCN